jgi:hypothetical protein
MARTDIPSQIDWTQCELIEQIPGKVSGRPIVRGTRILPDAIVNSYDAGEPLDLIRETIRGFPSRKSNGSLNSLTLDEDRRSCESVARRKSSASIAEQHRRS